MSDKKMVVDLAEYQYNRIGTCRYDEGQGVKKVWWYGWEDERAVLVVSFPGEPDDCYSWPIDTDDLPGDGVDLTPEHLAEIVHGDGTLVAVAR